MFERLTESQEGDAERIISQAMEQFHKDNQNDGLLNAELRLNDGEYGEQVLNGVHVHVEKLYNMDTSYTIQVVEGQVKSLILEDIEIGFYRDTLGQPSMLYISVKSDWNIVFKEEFIEIAVHI
jgi:hypothetical protein